MSKFPRIVVAILTVYLSAATAAMAQTTWIVDNVGGGDFTTIQGCIDSASVVDGDTCEVNEGTYVENIDFSGKNITVKSTSGPDTTIIDGNAAGSVVTFANGETVDAVLDGFTIRNGSATYGGGIICESSSPTVTNCTFSGNSAGQHGGGMHNNSSSPTVIDCTFSGNSAGSRGGGMYNENSSSPTVTNCTFSGNSNGSRGGGMANYFTSSPTVTNCTFSGNSASDYGGGMFNFTSSPTVTNCTFSGNSASSYSGGGISNFLSSPTVTNCTFSGNSAGQHGGGMSNSSSSPMVTNCILWGDSPQEFSNYQSSPVVTYSDIQGGYAGAGNINANPRFLDPDGPDNVFGTEDDDLHLTEYSPCIDKGTSSGAPDTDLEGNTRPQGDGYDMGAYESPFTKPKAMPWIPLLLLDD